MSIFETIIAELVSGKRPPALPDVLFPDEYGLVYVGGELTVASLIEAYAKGCFPWSGERPIPWFSPDPRLVLFPENFRPSRSLRKLARQKKFCIRFDADYREVMKNCAAIPRRGQKGTWITGNMIDVYTKLHKLNVTHSVAVYDRNGVLCGGLYGLTFGRAFFGESMFSRVPNASKLALYALCAALTAEGFDFIDCQQVTPHLMRLGAAPISRREFMSLLQMTLSRDSLHADWGDLFGRFQ